MNSRLLVRNTIWNLLGNVLPLVAGVFTIPFLIKGFGVERFGLLTISWALIGYFSLFDMGLGRALTRLAAERLGDNGEDAVPSLVSTTLLLLWGLGALGAIVVWLLSAWLANDVLAMPSALRAETRDTFRVLAVGVLFVVVTAGLRGVPEAYQRFDMISLMRLVLGVLTFVCPLLVLRFSVNLSHAVGVLVIVRILIWWAHHRAVKLVMPVRSGGKLWDVRWLGPLVSFGGWLTISNVVGPLMMYLDRFVIGSALSVAAVAYYTTPYEVVTRVLVVPVALSGVLFPAFASQWLKSPGRAGRVMERGATYTLVALFPVLLTVAFFAQELLSSWLGAEFARQGTLVLQWLAAGVLMNGVAQIFFSLLQGAGRSDWTAKLHLVELFPYLLVLWYLLTQYGVAGAAAAWCLRAAFDAFGMLLMSARLNDGVLKGALGDVPWMSGVGMGLVLSAMFMEHFELRMFSFAMIMLLFLPLVWLRMLGSTEREWLRSFLIKRDG